MHESLDEAGNYYIHESLDEFEIRPDTTTGFHGNR